MIANLIDNAVRHNNPGGGIEIRTIPQAESAVVEIANTIARARNATIPAGPSRWPRARPPDRPRS
jgi:hypothetical protein